MKKGGPIQAIKLGQIKLTESQLKIARMVATDTTLLSMGFRVTKASR
jgi:hypothetical protein